MPVAVPSRNLSSSRTAKNTQSTSSKPLYASQTTIPHLPVPSLSSTFHKYLETVQPLQSDSEHEKTISKVDKFLSSDFSKTLQSRLEKRAKEKDSWLSEWWNETAYMGYRGRLIPNVSYFYTHKHGLGKGQSQEDRAAELVRATVEFKKLVDRSVLFLAVGFPCSMADATSEILEPEKVKGQPLCMASYKYL